MAGLRSLLVFLAAFFVTVESDCPNGWVTNGDRCYHFSHDTEDWPAAHTICKILGGELTQIENDTEGVFLSTQATQNKISYWVGLSDTREEGAFRWVYSGELHGSTITYNNWAHGQPDNTHGDENCVYLVAANGKWADGKCHSPLHYICERSSL